MNFLIKALLTSLLLSISISELFAQQGIDDFMGPDYILPVPGIKKMKKLHSSGLVEETAWSENGIWEYDKLIFENGDFGGFSSWRYSAQTGIATIYMVDPETRDTVVTGNKKFNELGLLKEENVFLPKSSAHRMYFGYDEIGLLSEKVIEKLEDSELFIIQRDTLGRKDSVLVFSGKSPDRDFLKEWQKYTYPSDSTYIIKSYHIESRDSSRKLFRVPGYFVADLTEYYNFQRTFVWPDTSLFAEKAIKRVKKGDTLEVTLEFSSWNSHYRVFNDTLSEYYFIQQYLPKTNYGTFTYRKGSAEGLKMEEGQFRINGQLDTIWVSSVKSRFDRQGRLRNRVVYRGEPGKSPILRDLQFVHTDTSVREIRSFDQNGLKYQHEIERPDIHSNLIYHIVKKRWDSSLDRWEVYFEEKRNFDHAGREIYFEDSRAQIYRRYNAFGLCIEEEFISKLGDLPRRWEIEIEYY
jgi:hypothetical protein